MRRYKESLITCWRKKSHKNGKSVKRVGCHSISPVSTWHALEGKSTKMNFSYGLISNVKKKNPYLGTV